MKSEDLIEAERQQREQRWGDIPTPLRTRDQWVIIPENPPINPPTGWYDKSGWLPFDEAVHKANRHGMMIAFVLCKDDPFVVFDINRVVDGERLSTDAVDIVETLDSYTELSCSGTGLHVFLEGERLSNYTNHGSLSEGGGLDVYDAYQRIVMTGDIVRDQYQLTDGGGAAVQEEYLPKGLDDLEPPKEATFPASGKVEQTDGIGPADIRLTIEEFARLGSDEAERTRNYWTSSRTTLNGDRGRAESDMAFALDLAFWCREDIRLMDACFRESERMFDQWEQSVWRETTSGERKVIYGEDLIQKAKETNSHVLSGNYWTHR